MSQLWVFIEGGVISGTTVLSPEESRHVGTRRLRVGASLMAFDGRGHTAEATLTSVAKKAAEIEIGTVESSPPPRESFEVATAIPKGERLSTMLQMWTQLGLEVWQPLVCEDSAIRRLDIAAPRLQRILIEGCKVARRPFAMRILSPLRLEEALLGAGGDRPLYYADRNGRRGSMSSDTGRIFVGPEAGFTTEEIDRLDAAGATAISLGDYNLRIETAGVAAMALRNSCADPQGQP